MAVDPRAANRTKAEQEYGTGERRVAPLWSEMSPQTQGSLESGFSETLSNLRTKADEQKAKGLKGAVSESTREALVDKPVTISSAADEVKGRWDERMAERESGVPHADPSWYFAHNRRLTDVAEKHGADPNKVIDASASMSPQNGPDNEYRAVAAMVDAHQNKRMVREGGKSRRLSSMPLEEMQRVTSAANVENVSAAPDFDLAGFRSAGTNRQEGFRTVTDPEYNAIDKMETGKAPTYAKLIRESKPDSPVHHEFESRFHDQTMARDAERRGQPGVPDRVDLYGLKNTQDPISHHEDIQPSSKHAVLGTEGRAVTDTWMNAIYTGQEIDSPEVPAISAKTGKRTTGIGPTPAKEIASVTSSTGIPLGEHTFPGPTAAKASGGKPWTDSAAHHAAGERAIQTAAQRGAHPMSETNIPPVMMQEESWTQVRDVAARTSGKQRATKLLAGKLEEGRAYQAPEGSSDVPMSTPAGAFHRGWSDPHDVQGVTGLHRESSGSPGSPDRRMQRRNDAGLNRLHAAAAGAAPDEFSKRSAIRSAIDRRG